MSVYLDYNATTPVDPRVLDKMLPYFCSMYGNPSSRDHSLGWDAADAVTEAREHVAGLIGASPDEVVFTSGATESISWALKALASMSRARRAVTCSTEHEAVLETCHALQAAAGTTVAFLPVNDLGQVEPEVRVAAGAGEISFVSVMLANNEIGTLHEISSWAEVARSAGALLFSDITQGLGKVPIDVRALGIDVAAFSAHKVYGPKGAGALYIRASKPPIGLLPLIAGGGQEKRMRGGTLNVPGIVGFGEACRIASGEIRSEIARVRELRDALELALLSELSDIRINGDRVNRLANVTNIGFAGVDARALIRNMHDVAVSTRSACSSGAPGPSHVLKAIGLSDEDAYSCVRFSLGRFTTQDEIDYTIGKVVASVHKLRSFKSVRA